MPQISTVFILHKQSGKRYSSNMPEKSLLPNLLLRPMAPDDIPDVVAMEHTAWHEYYRQYHALYDLIQESVTPESLTKDWQAFFGISSNGDKTSMVIGQERCAYVAEYQGKIAAVGAASAYRRHVWPEVDALLEQPDGTTLKPAKFQELYVAPTLRKQGIGHALAYLRGMHMLHAGFNALFLTVYADAEKTIQYHLKNGLKQVHSYPSLQRFKEGKTVEIACFLHPSLQSYTDTSLHYLKARHPDLASLTQNAVLDSNAGMP